MFKNNFITFTLHSIWFVLIAFFVLNSPLKAISILVIPDITLRYVAFTVLTLIFTIFVTGLFIKPRNSTYEDFISNILLFLLEIVGMGGLTILFIMGKLSLYHLGIFTIAFLIQFIIIFIILAVKGGEENE